MGGGAGGFRIFRMDNITESNPQIELVRAGELWRN